MNKALLSYFLLICSVLVAYFYVSDFIDKNSTNNLMVNTSQIIKKQPLLDKVLIDTGVNNENQLLSGENFGEVQKYTLEQFIIDAENSSHVIKVITGNSSILYIGMLPQMVEQGWGINNKVMSGFDVYGFEFLNDSLDFDVKAIRGDNQTQDQVYTFMKEIGIANEICILDNEGFETYTNEDKKLVDDYIAKYKEYNEKGIEFIDDGTVPVNMCGRIKIFCNSKGCGYVINTKNGGGDGFMISENSLIAK